MLQPETDLTCNPRNQIVRWQNELRKRKPLAPNQSKPKRNSKQLCRLRSHIKSDSQLLIVTASGKLHIYYITSGGIKTLADHNVSSACAAQSGYLIICTLDGGIHLMDPMTGVYIQAAFVDRPVRSIAVMEAQSCLIAATSHAIWRTDIA